MVFVVHGAGGCYVGTLATANVGHPKPDVGDVGTLAKAL